MAVNPLHKISNLSPCNIGEKTNLTKEFQDTDRTIQKIRWKTYGPQKLFDTKLRFRIRLDDFRQVLKNRYGLMVDPPF